MRRVPQLRGQLTVVAPLATPADRAAADALADLRTRMAQCEAAREGALVGPVRPCPVCAIPALHFLRILLLPAETRPGRGACHDASVVLWTVFDGPLDAHVASLVEEPFGSELDAVLRACRGYPAAPSPDRRREFLLDHRERHPTFFDGLPGWTRATIEAEARLRSHLDSVLAKLDPNRFDPSHLLLRLRETLLRDPAFAPLLQEPIRRQVEPRPQPSRVQDLLRAGIDLLLRTWAPRTESPDPDDAAVRAISAQLTIEEDERVGGVNRGTILDDVKPHWTHALVLRVALWLARVVQLPRNDDGRLSQIGTIHCAEWLLCDRGRRLLFFTNYDGTWDVYFADFSLRAASRLNAIWGNTVGFPPTVGLHRGGAHDREAFIAAARIHQIPTRVWHSPLPRHLTMARIRTNARIRDGLTRWPSPEEAVRWLTLFGRCDDA